MPGVVLGPPLSGSGSSERWWNLCSCVRMCSQICSLTLKSGSQGPGPKKTKIRPQKAEIRPRKAKIRPQNAKIRPEKAKIRLSKL